MKKLQKAGVKAAPKKEIEILFDKYAMNHQHPSSRLIQWVCVPLVFFSIIGLVWCIPFPHLAFLNRYNGFLNWASFLIAFVGYYYYRLSPVLSYIMILVIFALAMVVVQLEKWALIGGPAVWLVCTVIFVLACIGQFIGHKIEGKKPPFADDLRFLLIGPLWQVNFLAIKAGLKLH